MNKKILAAAAALAVLLGGCATPSERPGQASPTPAPAASTTTTTETAAPASPTPTPSAPAETASATPAPAATPTPATPDLGVPRMSTWGELLKAHPTIEADLIKAGLNTDGIAAQAAIRTTKGEVPNATVTVAFGSTPGGELLSTGGCKVASELGECPSEGLIEGLLPIAEQRGGELYRDYSKGVLVGFTADNQPFVLYELTLEKR